MIGRPTKISQELIDKAIDLRVSGKIVKEISKELGISVSYLDKMFARLKKENLIAANKAAVKKHQLQKKFGVSSQQELVDKVAKLRTMMTQKLVAERFSKSTRWVRDMTKDHKLKQFFVKDTYVGGRPKTYASIEDRQEAYNARRRKKGHNPHIKVTVLPTLEKPPQRTIVINSKMSVQVDITDPRTDEVIIKNTKLKYGLI